VVAVADACIICGHDRDQHPPNHFAMFGWHCKVVGCPCGQFEPANPTVEGAQGGDAVAQVPALRPEPALQRQRLTKPATATDPTGAVAGPPDDLHQAIQAATTALCDQHPAIGLSDPWAQVARIAVEAAMPVLLHATRDRHADLHQAIQAATDARLRAALQVDGPARGHAILAEVQRLRKVEQAAREFLDAAEAVPQAVSWDEFQAAANRLGDALDQAAQREDDR
jgi:hypothetical protein